MKGIICKYSSEKSQNKWATKAFNNQKKKKEMLEKEEICFPELPHYINKINNIRLKITRHKKKQKKWLIQRNKRN